MCMHKKDTRCYLEFCLFLFDTRSSFSKEEGLLSLHHEAARQVRSEDSLSTDRSICLLKGVGISQAGRISLSCMKTDKEAIKHSSAGELFFSFFLSW